MPARSCRAPSPVRRQVRGGGRAVGDGTRMGQGLGAGTGRGGRPGR